MPDKAFPLRGKVGEPQAQSEEWFGFQPLFMRENRFVFTSSVRCDCVGIDATASAWMRLRRHLTASPQGEAFVPSNPRPARLLYAGAGLFFVRPFLTSPARISIIIIAAVFKKRRQVA